MYSIKGSLDYRLIYNIRKMEIIKMFISWLMNMLVVDNLNNEIFF